LEPCASGGFAVVFQRLEKGTEFLGLLQPFAGVADAGRARSTGGGLTQEKDARTTKDGRRTGEADSGHCATNAWNRIEVSFLGRADTTWTYENVSEIINRELKMARLLSRRCGMSVGTLTAKCAIVTGASTGIGAGIAKSLARRARE
jgi:hypothetical protein